MSAVGRAGQAMRRSGRAEMRRDQTTRAVDHDRSAGRARRESTRALNSSGIGGGRVAIDALRIDIGERAAQRHAARRAGAAAGGFSSRGDHHAARDRLAFAPALAGGLDPAQHIAGGEEGGDRSSGNRRRSPGRCVPGSISTWLGAIKAVSGRNGRSGSHRRSRCAPARSRDRSRSPSPGSGRGCGAGACWCRTGTPKPRRAIHLPGRRAVMRAFSSIIASGLMPAWRRVSKVEKATSSLPMIDRPLERAGCRGDRRIAAARRYSSRRTAARRR